MAKMTAQPRTRVSAQTTVKRDPTRAGNSNAPKSSAATRSNNSQSFAQQLNRNKPTSTWGSTSNTQNLVRTAAYGGVQAMTNTGYADFRPKPSPIASIFQALGFLRPAAPAVQRTPDVAENGIRPQVVPASPDVNQPVLGPPLPPPGGYPRAPQRSPFDPGGPLSGNVQPVPHIPPALEQPTDLGGLLGAE